MAYLKLKSSKLRRLSGQGNDFIILSQVVGSQSSYEVPKKVKTLEELEEWFGNSYPDYDYHRELLNSGASLLLYKPISLEKRRDTESYIDYSGFPIDTSETIYENPDEIKPPGDRLIYRAFDEDLNINEYILKNNQLVPLSEKDNDIEYIEDDIIYYRYTEIQVNIETPRNTLYQYISGKTGEISYCLWVDEAAGYIDINDLPQNIGVADRSVSWNNRSTLTLSSPSSIGTYVSHPRFSDKDYVIFINEEQKDIIRETVFDRGGDTSNLTYAVKLDFSEVTEFPRDSYICFYVGYNQVRKMIYFGNSGNIPSSDYVGIDNRYYINPERSKEDVISDIWDCLLNQTDTLEGRESTIVYHRYEDSNILWSEYPFPMDHFYKLPGFKVIRDYRLSYDLTSLAAPESRISFEPKTIGLHEIPISITIEKQQAKGLWQVIVRRGSAEEYHLGSIFQNQNYESLEYVINRDSKLVRCKLNHYRDNGKSRWKELDPVGTITDSTIVYSDLRYCTRNNQYYLNGDILPNPDLPEGTWELLGATSETYGYQEYTRALDALSQEALDLSEDFLMIPRMSDYRENYELSDVSWYPEYKTILNYCKTKNCQAVISNNDTGSEYWFDTISEFKNSISDPQSSWTYKVNLPKALYTSAECMTENSETSIGILSISVEYATGEYFEAPVNGWKKEIPKTGTGKYIWTRSIVEYYNETTVISQPERLLSGPEVLRITPQYYLSDYNNKQEGDSMWHNSIPKWQTGKYLWIRQKIEYKECIAYYRYIQGQWIEQVIGRDICNPWLNEFIWNYVITTDSLENPKDLDPDNYLVYFYKTIINPQGQERPGYYVFLDSILRDNHVVRREDIFYTSPVVDPIYPTETEAKLERNLESKKSNYLVTDGYQYYYKKYLNHVGSGKYNISILSKFYQSKLSRDFDNAKWTIIGQLTQANMIQVIEGILSSFVNSFRLVYSATLNDFKINQTEGSAKIWVTVRSKELVDKDINLNITLNYIY